MGVEHRLHLSVSSEVDICPSPLSRLNINDQVMIGKVGSGQRLRSIQALVRKRTGTFSINRCLAIRIVQVTPIPGPSAIPSFLYDPSFPDCPVSAGLLFDPRRAKRNQLVPPKNKGGAARASVRFDRNSEGRLHRTKVQFGSPEVRIKRD